MANVLQWLAILSAGGGSGAAMAIVVLHLRLRRACQIAAYEIEEPDFDALAKAWAEDTGRPWAARSVADKMRLLSRLERDRDARRRS